MYAVKKQRGYFSINNVLKFELYSEEGGSLLIYLMYPKILRLLLNIPKDTKIRPFQNKTPCTNFRLYSVNIQNIVQVNGLLDL